MRQYDHIEMVAKNELCTQCGTCEGVCPNSAIKILKKDSNGCYVPKVDHSRCIECGICAKVCLGEYVDFKRLNRLIFDRDPENALLGNYVQCYVGYAADPVVRNSSTSGGLVTALLSFALEEGFIDSALVTRNQKENPLQPKSFIARTTDEVKEASGSKYCPVPANIAIKELSERAGKIATVGLPCHIHGIRKAEEINEGLKDKISLHFGLFCSRGVNFSGTEFWLDKLRVRKENIENIAYRSKGWPGGTLVELEGNSKFIPQSKFWNIFSLFFFVNMRCLFCSDQTSELADVSFGDAWLPRFEGNKLGWSVIISRTEIGEQILRKAAENNVIKLEAINAREVIRSQLSSLYFKKRNLKARENMFRKKLSDNSAAFHPHFGDYCLALFSFLNSYLSTKPFSKSILKHIPLAGLAAYGWSFSLLLKKILRDFEKCY